MTQSIDKYATYASDFAAMTQEPCSSELTWLSEIRNSAWSRFKEIGMPVERRGNERWKYTNVAPIANSIFRHTGNADSTRLVSRIDGGENSPWDENWTNVVCVDGRYSAD